MKILVEGAMCSPVKYQINCKHARARHSRVAYLLLAVNYHYEEVQTYM